MSEQPNMRQCSMCQEWFPATREYFHSQGDGKGTLKARCKTCCNAMDRGELLPVKFKPVYGDPSQKIRCLVCQEQFPATTEYFRRMGREGEFHKQCKSCCKAIYRGNLVVIDPFKCAEGYKRCTKCRKCKPAIKAYFNAYKRSSDGLRAVCNECRSQEHQENGDKNRERVRDWNKRNSRRHVENVKQWRIAHPEKEVINVERRRARRKGLPDTLTLKQWLRALDYFGWCCAVCRKDLRGDTLPAADHWKPLSKGGPTTAENIIPLCHGKGSCNNYKQALMPEVWLKRLLGEEKAREKLAEIEVYFQWVRQQGKE